MKNIATGFLTVCTLFAVLSTHTLAIDGDYNDNGVVDAADYTVWRDNLDTSITLPNDPSPGNVDADDYLVWRSNYGSGTPAAPQSPGSDDPSVIITSLGSTPNGNLAFSVAVTKPAGTYSLAVELAFTGPIAQVQFFGSDINDSVNAESLDGIGGYEKEEDTWYQRFNWFDDNPGNNPFTGTITEGYVAGTNTLFTSLGGGPHTPTVVPFLYLVLVAPSGLEVASSAADPPPILGQWTGIVAMDGVNYSSSGDIVIPQPASLVFTVIAALAMLGCRRGVACR